MERLQELARQQISVLYVQCQELSVAVLRRAAERVWQCVRHEDVVLLGKGAFLVVLLEVEAAGAQAVAARIRATLADIEHDVRVLGGEAAQMLLQRVQTEQAVVVKQRSEPIESPAVLGPQPRRSRSLPYLAFLANYPSQRLLHLIPYDIAYRYHFVPVGAERGVLTLATYEQLQQEVISTLQQITQRSIFQVRCEFEVINDVLRYWRQSVIL